jgi:DNA-binding NtrC family response regulator
MLSAYGDKGHYRKSMAAGANDFLEKNANPAEIRGSIAAMLDHHKTSAKTMRVLLYDQIENEGNAIARALADIDYIQLTKVHDANRAIAEMVEYDVVIANQTAPEISGFELIMAYKRRYPSTATILFAAEDTMMHLNTIEIDMIAISGDETPSRIESFLSTLMA